MRMRAYCQRGDVRCTRAVMLVNSPRMRRAARVPSNTHGLLFTALAARYDTRAEEMVLRMLVAVGV